MSKINKDLVKISELTEDLQRVRADFENYRKRVESEKKVIRELGQKEMVVKLLPVIDNIKRATANVPTDLIENPWVQGVITLDKSLDKILLEIGIGKIISVPGTKFNPDLHHAVQFEEDSEGEQEVISEELQSGYVLGDQVLRESMVKVKRQ